MPNHIGRWLGAGAVVAAVAAIGAWPDPGAPSKLNKAARSVAAPNLRARMRPAAAAPKAAPPRSAPKSEQVFHARWGSAPGELGRRVANESSPEGPASFAVDGHGRAFVLDQVNGRVQVFESGKAPRSLPVPSDTYQDVALTRSDGLVLLDRLSKESVAFADASGKVTHEVPLVGKGVAEAGDVTGLFQRDDGTWVEVKHANLVKIADADGAPLEERTIAQGRFGAEGSQLRASKSGASSAFVAQKTDRGVEPLAKVEFELPVWQLLELETDARGRVFLGASLLDERAEAPFDVLDAREVVVVLDPSGSELGRLDLPASTGAEESFRRIRVGADGTVYHLAWDEHGATMRRLSL